MLIGLGVPMRFVDGNHDDHPRLKKLRGRVRVRGVEIAKNVIYQPRGSVHEDEDGTRFCSWAARRRSTVAGAS